MHKGILFRLKADATDLSGRMRGFRLQAEGVRRLALVAAIAAGSSVLLVGQAPQEQPPSFRSSIDAVQMSVIVTDGQGKLKLSNLPPPLADGLVGLWLTDRAGAVEERQRAQLTTGTADAAPRPSPDGRWIAYLTDTQQSTAVESNIWIIAVDTAEGRAPEEYNLTAGEGNNWAPTWMPMPVIDPTGT